MAAEVAPPAPPVYRPEPKAPTAVIILAVLLALALGIAAVCAFGWFTATQARALPVQVKPPVQVKVVGSAAYTTATVTAVTANGSTSDALEATTDNRNTYWMTTVAAGDLVTVSVSPSGLSADPLATPTATVGCKIVSADGVTVLSEQTGLRGVPAVCTWRNA